MRSVPVPDPEIVTVTEFAVVSNSKPVGAENTTCPAAMPPFLISVMVGPVKAVKLGLLELPAVSADSVIGPPPTVEAV
jgi:hypothetical protein